MNVIPVKKTIIVYLEMAPSSVFSWNQKTMLRTTFMDVKIQTPKETNNTLLVSNV